MAEGSSDNMSDLDLSDDESVISDLDKTFNKASNHMKRLVAKLETSDLLKAYALYKQATEGPCEISAPYWYEMKAKQKWEAWSRLGNMPSDNAKENYITLISELDPSWSPDVEAEGGDGSWARVSTLQMDTDDNEESHTVFDKCKDGSIEDVVLAIKEDPEILKQLDDDGLGLVHWAADRGHNEMLSILLSMKCDISLRDTDGQTALHYAASCGHLDCVKVLLANGADKKLLDEEGFTAADVASDDDIKILCS